MKLTLVYISTCHQCRIICNKGLQNYMNNHMEGCHNLKYTICLGHINRLTHRSNLLLHLLIKLSMHLKEIIHSFPITRFSPIIFIVPPPPAASHCATSYHVTTNVLSRCGRTITTSSSSSINMDNPPTCTSPSAHKDDDVPLNIALSCNSFTSCHHSKLFLLF
jgi:hypothetical protein